MITAYGDAETKRKALEGGAEALFTEPIDFGALRSEIDTRVERGMIISAIGGKADMTFCTAYVRF